MSDISRAKAIKILSECKEKGFKHTFYTLDEYHTAMDMAINSLKIDEQYDLMYEQVEPETGHWEWLTEDKYRCSNCNSETRVDECMNEPMYSFCPFCGADMRGENE